MRLRALLGKIYRTLFPITMVEMYKRMGVQIGNNCDIQFDVVIDHSHYWLITIGNNVTIAPRVHILAHDASMKKKIGYTMLGKVTIQDDVFIGAGTVILPGVTIGANSIIGAGSTVSKNIPPNMVAAGSPAKPICSIDEFLERHKKQMDKYPVFDESYTLRANVGREKMQEMINKMGDGPGYVE